MAIRLEDVAEAAGVSVTTVSRVIGDRGPVAPATRARVEAAVEELGYRRSTLLPRAEARLVAVCTPPSPEHWQMEVCMRVASGLQREGLLVALPSISSDTSEVHACVAAGAAAVISPTFTSVDVDVPVVRFAEAGSGAESASPAPASGAAGEVIAARIDLVGALTLAFDHLSALGHRRIGLICNDEGTLAAALQERFLAEHPAAGFSDRLADWIAAVPKSFAGGIDAALRLKDETCTAVIVQSGLQLYGVLDAMRRRRYVVPRDLSVVGLGDSLTVRYTQPPTTSLGFSTEHMSGALIAAARSVLSLPGESMPAVPPTFRPMLIARSSTTGALR